MFLIEIQSSDDVIFVSLSTIEKFTKFISKNPIQFHPVETEDFFFSVLETFFHINFITFSYFPFLFSVLSVSVSKSLTSW